MTNVWPLQKDCIAFYGDPRHSGWLEANTVRVPCPWPLHIENTPVAAILIHKKCAGSLKVVLGNMWDSLGHDIEKVKAQRYDVFDGSYNLRSMRGSSQMSMHSFACAIDWDAEHNAFHSQRHFFTDASLLVVKFKEEGWSWGGDWSNPDAMHVQAARVS